MLCACGCLPHRRTARLTAEPSIERALDLLGTVREAAPTLRALRRNPVLFDYYDAPAGCGSFPAGPGRIHLPRGLKDNDALLAAALAKAAYIHRMNVGLGTEENVSEQEEAAVLFQARVLLEIGLKSDDFRKTADAKAIGSDLCTYVMQGAEAAVRDARAAALSVQPECRRPMDTLRKMRERLSETHEAMDDSAAFFRLLKDRDLDKVRKGTLTMAEAVKNDAEIRALPTYELYRKQRELYDIQTTAFDRLTRFCRSAMKEDAAWRKSNQSLIDAARKDLSDCDLPQ